MIILNTLLGLLALTLLVPLAVLVVESIAALLPARQGRLALSRPRAAVLIPAHNEEAGIPRTLNLLRPQLQAGDRILVVADNCTDQTAGVARAHGARVVERTDPDHRGKGYALDYGLRSLDSDPPEVVVIVDADCALMPGALDCLVRSAAASGRPMQAEYLLEVPPAAGIKAPLSAFAFLVKNLVRPRGLDRLGLPCLLTGTGMAFPWSVLRHEANLASGNIVEDMQMGLDLAIAGWPPAFCSGARVLSELPTNDKAAFTQRTRWEHGHLQTLLSNVPRLVSAALWQRRLDLLGLALELAVPPLSMLVLVSAAALGMLTLAALLGASPWPALALGGVGIAFALALLAAWARFGRGLVPLATLLSAPLYIVWKVPMYLAFLGKREKAWVRTERASPSV